MFQLVNVYNPLLLDPIGPKVQLRWSHIHLSMLQSSDFKFKKDAVFFLIKQEALTEKAVNERSLGQKKLNLPHSIAFPVPGEGKLVHLDLQMIFYSILPLPLAIMR